MAARIIGTINVGGIVGFIDTYGNRETVVYVQNNYCPSFSIDAMFVTGNIGVPLKASREDFIKTGYIKTIPTSR
jgi:hypothetical protein